MKIPVLSQRDPRWASLRLGYGDCTIGSDGCLLTSMTMVAGLSDVAAMNEYRKAHNGFAGAMAATFSLLNVVPGVAYQDASDRYPRKAFPDVDRFQAHLRAGNPAIVEVNWNRRFRQWLWRFKYDMHFVVAMPDAYGTPGSGAVYDPWPRPEEGKSVCTLADYGRDLAEAIVRVVYYQGVYA